MGFLDFLKRKKVPDELPDLATDEIQNKMKQEVSGANPAQGPIPEKSPSDVSEIPRVDSNNSKDEEDKGDEKESKGESSYSSDKKEKSDDDYAKEVKRAVLEPKTRPSKGFFSGLQEDISGELSDIDKMEDWYEHKFLPKDIVAEMREYWENQKTNAVLDALGKNFKERINDKVENLQALEKDWQNIYFDLVEKEDEMKQEEEELKKLLSEFMEVCKRKKGILKDNGQKKARGKEKK